LLEENFLLWHLCLPLELLLSSALRRGLLCAVARL
jgi:hypothetical protein